MCGIIGYVGYRGCQDVLFEGLRRLEYRGYDSAGVAWLHEGRTTCVRAVGNLDSLRRALAEFSDTNGRASPTAVADVEVGIGHTRWATHGGVDERNAHPHTDSSGRVSIVLNGIIENHLELRRRLAADGIACNSDTDAEVVAHLVGVQGADDLASAVRQTLPALEGHYAFVAMSEDEPETLVGVRQECPLVIGLGDDEQFIASSMTAFLAHTRNVVALDDGKIAVLRPRDVITLSHDGIARKPRPTQVTMSEETCEKEGFETFMLKEIHEQARATRDTLSYWGIGEAAGAVLSDEVLSDVGRIVLVGCGTSYHAGLLGRSAIERWARVPVDVEVASEFRYSDPILDSKTLVLAITQSGETADTLAAMRLARERGARVTAITNVAGSQATRESDAVLYTRAGTEIGVAATKTFAAQVVLLYALALRLARVTGHLGADEMARLRQGLEELPEQIAELVLTVDGHVREVAERLSTSPFFLYLGRLSGFPVALEGALKLKEISYVPAEAYPAGEMKHGPIALLSEATPVVCVANEQLVRSKLLSNVCEVRAREAPVLAVAPTGCAEIAEHAEDVFYVPPVDPLVQAVLAVVPLQLLAYHVARARGLNVDQPRNLAKTVTVE